MWIDIHALRTGFRLPGMSNCIQIDGTSLRIRAIDNLARVMLNRERAVSERPVFRIEPRIAESVEDEVRRRRRKRRGFKGERHVFGEGAGGSFRERAGFEPVVEPGDMPVEMGVGAFGAVDLLAHGVEAFRFPADGAQDIERDHVAGAFPDGVQRRGAEVTRHRSFLDEARAAVTLEGFVNKPGLALADPVFADGGREPHEGGLFLVRLCIVEAAGEAEGKRGCGFGFENEIREHRRHGGLVDEFLLERASMLRMPQGFADGGAHAAGGAGNAVEPRMLDHVDDGAHAAAFFAETADAQQIKTQLSNALQNDIMALFNQQIGNSRDVSINNAVLQQVVGQLGGQTLQQ